MIIAIMIIAIMIIAKMIIAIMIIAIMIIAIMIIAILTTLPNFDGLIYAATDHKRQRPMHIWKKRGLK